MAIELDEEFIKAFYEITEVPVPGNVDLPALKKQLTEVIELVEELDKNSRKSKKAILAPKHVEENEEAQTPAILIIDDLGVITYQLKVLLKSFNYDIDISHEIYDAVNKYRKRNYEFVIMDLFIPTDREGFMLLAELRKIADSLRRRPIIGIMTASNKKELEHICKNKGADFFIEKSADWQQALYAIIDQFINDTENK